MDRLINLFNASSISENITHAINLSAQRSSQFIDDQFLKITRILNIDLAIKNIKQQQTKFLQLFFVFFIISMLIIYLKLRIKHNPRQRIRNYEKIEQKKIIIALEIENFIVKYTNIEQKSYIPLNKLNENSNWFFRFMNKLFGYGHFYKPMYSFHKIKQFLLTLSNMQNSELFIYTRLPKQITEQILHRMQLQNIIKPQRRIYYIGKSQDMLKHAIQVDNDTRRVVIVTPDLYDHSEEDDKYFLNLKSNNNSAIFLKQALWYVNYLINKNKNIDKLHDQLANLKVQIEQTQQKTLC